MSDEIRREELKAKIKEQLDTLSIEDLENVAGGGVGEWTKSERDHLYELKRKYDHIRDEYNAGRATEADLDAVMDEMSRYIYQIDQKYRGK